MKLAIVLLGLATIFIGINQQPVAAQELVAVRAQASLPKPRDSSSAIYDGDDNIYIFGGYDGSSLSDSLKYSISRDTIENAGTLPSVSYAGRSLLDKNNNIYHIVGYFVRAILQFFRGNNTFLKVSQLPAADYGYAIIKPDPDTALLFGGYSLYDGIIRINLTNFQTDRLPYNLPKRVGYAGACWIEESGVAYIFSGSYASDSRVVKYKHFTNQYEILPGDFPIPNDDTHTQCIHDGRYCYIVGYRSADVPSGNIIQFDPQTEEYKILPVGGDLDWTENKVSGTSPVYVEKLNRIYIFGGYGSRYFNNIWYIDLDPISTQPPKSTTSEPPITEVPSSISQVPITSTPEPIEEGYCLPYPKDIEDPINFPHTDNNVSTTCGEHLYFSSGGIFYKDNEVVLPNERCIWTIAVPEATGYNISIRQFGYDPKENNDDGLGLIISDFGSWRAPNHYVP